MRYRAMSATGDYQFGRTGIFFVDSPEAVVQAIKTRLGLWTGEWFLDSDEGTPYIGQILGHGTQATRDVAIKTRLLETPGVLSLLKYSSSVTADRRMVVAAEVETQFGATQVSLVLG